MSSKNNTQNSNNISGKNSTSNAQNTGTGRNAAGTAKVNADSGSQNALGNTSNYVSGDASRSSSSHQFHKS